MRVVQEKHLLATCGKFKMDQWIKVDEVSRIVRAGEWLKECGRVCKEDKVVLL